MSDSNSKVKESDDRPLIEAIYQINYFLLGEGAATCQVCGSSFQEGDAVVVYVFRPVEATHYQVGQAVCGNDRHKLIEEFTLGVRELLVAGRVGVCSDAATQSSHLVLLTPELLGVSAAATRSLRWIPADDATDVTEATADEDSADAPGAVSVGEAHRRADEPNGDATQDLFGGGQ
jgi:hypothetical protein